MVTVVSPSPCASAVPVPPARMAAAVTAARMRGLLMGPPGRWCVGHREHRCDPAPPQLTPGGDSPHLDNLGARLRRPLRPSVTFCPRAAFATPIAHGARGAGPVRRRGAERRDP